MERLPIIQNLTNRILFRQTRANRVFNDFILCLEGKTSENFLFTLLNLMSLIILVDPKFRKNVENFDARYVFMYKSENLYIVAHFKNNKLNVKKSRVTDPNLTLVFKDGKALFKLLLSESPDVLNAILNQEVDFNGNLNYLNKFAYMAMRLKLMAEKLAPVKKA
ncbi:MAG: hypothetical protein FWC36_03330 [Spirochaetes bacterium]|nr:hypothetical protein [Spirochaetota bacterium]